MPPEAAAPRVAVCLAAHNGRRWLPAQLDSILDQAGVEVTVFVSVDASRDDTEAWVDARAAADPRIRVLPHGRRFGGAAPNFFRLLREVDFAGFDHVSLADQDDIWFRDKLMRAHQRLQQTGSDAYSSDVLALWPSSEVRLIRKSQPQRRWDHLFEAAGPGCTYVLRRPLAQAAQELLRREAAATDRVGLHDWFLYAFARSRGCRWFIDDRPGLLYRQHESNLVGVNQGWPALRRRALRVADGWWLDQARLIARLVGADADAWVQGWTRGGRLAALRLALELRECRRRVRDQLLFALACLFMALRPAR